MTPEQYQALKEPFPEEAIERTRGSETRKGYDTTGIKYQWVVNRLNDVLTPGGWRTSQEFSVRETKARSGQQMYEVSCDIVIKVGGVIDNGTEAAATAFATGGHRSNNEADAKKGAYTNGLKKAAAMLGCGWQAYAGAIDDDNAPAPGGENRSPGVSDELDCVLEMIAKARNKGDLLKAASAAKTLDDAEKKKAKPAWAAKQRELARSEEGR
jgi:hypothetical protein